MEEKIREDLVELVYIDNAERGFIFKTKSEIKSLLTNLKELN